MNLSHQQRAALLACLEAGRLRPEALRYVASSDTGSASGQMYFRKATISSLIGDKLMEPIKQSGDRRPSRWPIRLTPLGDLHARQLRANDLGAQADRLTEEAMA